MKAFSFILGAAAGGAAAWFLDPNDGARRRSMAQDKAGKYARKGAAEVGTTAQRAAGSAKGAVAQASPAGGRESAGERLNDAGLKAKVESEMFRKAEAPKGDVSVSVEDRVVYLRGEVGSPDTITKLGRAAQDVEGVQGVENLLHGPGEPART